MLNLVCNKSDFERMLDSLNKAGYKKRISKGKQNRFITIDYMDKDDKLVSLDFYNGGKLIGIWK